ncbi:MAG: class I tRNA ligase family protein, partial [archaeon]|nr:class I tRNA ligase family protein [archaeon]
RFLKKVKKLVDDNKGRLVRSKIDFRKLNMRSQYFIGLVHRTIRTVTCDIDEFRFNFAVGSIMNLVSETRKFSLLKKDDAVLTEAIHAIIRLLAPFAPHLSEDLWMTVGGKGLVCVSRWPQVNKAYLDLRVEMMDLFVRDVVDDSRRIIQLIGREPVSVNIYVAPSWKHTVYNIARGKPENLMKAVMADDKVRKKGPEASRYAQSLMKRPVLEEVLDAESEYSALETSCDVISEELGCRVSILKAEDSDSEKAKRAEPGKPGIEIT